MNVSQEMLEQLREACSALQASIDQAKRAQALLATLKLQTAAEGAAQAANDLGEELASLATVETFWTKEAR